MLFRLLGNRSLWHPERSEAQNVGLDRRKLLELDKAMNELEEIVLSRDESRAVDEAAVDQLGLLGLLLMENAARGVADVLFDEFALDPKSGNKGRAGVRVFIICGPGNNGGDGLCLARQLAARGLAAEVCLFRAGKQLTHDAEFNLNVLRAARVDVAELNDGTQLAEWLTAADSSDVIVDCLLGTGIRGAVLSPFAELIDVINRMSARVVAVDVPSGLDCDRGHADSACVRAELTVTFVGKKRGFLNPGAAAATGKVYVAHIGLPDSWVRRWLAIRRCPTT